MKRSDLHSGDLLYWKGKGFFPWLVRFWTRSPYAHVAVFFQNGQGGAYIEAQPKTGVQFVPFDADPPQACQTTHCAWSYETTHKVLSYQGRPYSFRTAIATVFGVAGKGTSAFMCSELAINILSLMGWDFHNEKYTPIGLARAVERATGNPIVEYEP